MDRRLFEPEPESVEMELDERTAPEVSDRFIRIALGILVGLLVGAILYPVMAVSSWHLFNIAVPEARPVFPTEPDDPRYRGTTAYWANWVACLVICLALALPAYRARRFALAYAVTVILTATAVVTMTHLFILSGGPAPT